MPYKDHIIRAAKNKTFNLSWYQRNKDRHRDTQRINRRKARDEWIEFKSSLECQKCGFKHPAAIDFHHTNPENKEGEVNNWARNGQYARARAEVEKCIPLCSNCHRILHFEENRARIALQDSERE